MYSNQTGQISGHSDVRPEFCIKAGVRQGCVLSPRLFCSVLQLAMEDWRCDVSNNGLDLGDGGPPLLDLRFAVRILLFAGSAEQLGYMLDKLVTSLGKVSLKLNAAKTKVLTTQAQPPKTLTTRAGLEIGVLDQSSSHKWLGCMLSTANAGKRQDDIDHRLQSAARAFHVHKWILCEKIVSMASRLKFFDAMITSVVCFAAGHRKIYTNDLRKLEVHCRECFDGLWVRQLTSIGTSRGIQCFIHGTTGLINNWNTMVSRYGQRNICLSIGNLQITLLCLMKIAGWSASYIGTQEVEGLDGHFSNGKLQYKIFAAGIG